MTRPKGEFRGECRRCLVQQCFRQYCDTPSHNSVKLRDVQSFRSSATLPYCGGFSSFFDFSSGCFCSSGARAAGCVCCCGAVRASGGGEARSGCERSLGAGVCDRCGGSLRLGSGRAFGWVAAGCVSTRLFGCTAGGRFVSWRVAGCAGRAVLLSGWAAGAAAAGWAAARLTGGL